MSPPVLNPIALAKLLPNDDVVQGRQPSIQHAVRRLLAAEPGLCQVAQGRAPTRDEVAALHTTCYAVVFSLSSRIPPSLRAAVARWLEAATRRVGHPTPACVPSESVTLAQELLAFAAPIAMPSGGPPSDPPAAAALREMVRELEELLARARSILNTLETSQ